MSHMRLWTAAAIIALVVIVGFAFSVPHTRDVAKTTKELPENVPPVALHDTFKKGLHTITGSIKTSNACTTITANATVTGAASGAKSILVAISMPKDAGVCLQLPTTVGFSVAISAPAHLPITATINGSEASTTNI